MITYVGSSNLDKLYNSLNSKASVRTLARDLYKLDDSELSEYLESSHLNDFYDNLSREGLIDLYNLDVHILGINTHTIVLKEGFLLKISSSLMTMSYRNSYIGDCYLGDFRNLKDAILYLLGLTDIKLIFSYYDTMLLNSLSDVLYKKI